MFNEASKLRKALTGLSEQTIQWHESVIEQHQKRIRYFKGFIKQLDKLAEEQEPGKRDKPKPDTEK